MRLSALVSAILLFSSVSAVAATAPMHEVSGGTSSSIDFGTKGQSTVFKLDGGYGYFVNSQWEISGDLGFLTTSGFTVLAILAGPTYNFAPNGESTTNAFFAGARLGMAHVSENSVNSSTDLAYLVEAGKRFEIFSNVSWKPKFAIGSTTADNASLSFSLTPLSFSILF